MLRHPDFLYAFDVRGLYFHANLITEISTKVKSINIPRRSRGFFIDGQSPMILATRHVTLVRPDIRVLSLSATRKRVF